MLITLDEVYNAYVFERQLPVRCRRFLGRVSTNSCQIFARGALWLCFRQASNDSLIVNLRAYGGYLDITRTKIFSWDLSEGDYDKEPESNGRRCKRHPLQNHKRNNAETIQTKPENTTEDRVVFQAAETVHSTLLAIPPPLSPFR